MSALAELFLRRGVAITGCDAHPETAGDLRRLGVSVTDHDPSHVDSARALVVTSAMPKDHPELVRARERGIPVIRRAEALGEVTVGRELVGIAGTHGKTTTTAMLAWTLDQAGRDPGFLIGGLPHNFARSWRIGKGPAFVIEGDEYDTAFFDKGPKFMHYRPDTALISTVEFDHADIYRDEDDVKRAFRWLTSIVPRRGLIVRHEDSPNTRDVTSHAQARVEGYGIAGGTWRADRIEHGADGVSFRILRGGEAFAQVALPISGEYNVRNALAVTAAAHEQGLSPQEIAKGLSTFKGVKRRMDVVGEVGGVLVLDDFAHHPTAIAETLRAVRQRYPGRRLLAVLEPRSGSLRRKVFQDKLPPAFDHADEIVLAEVFSADKLQPEERLDPARLVEDIAGRGRSARFLPGVDEIVAYLAKNTRKGDVIAVLSNGGFGGIHQKLLDAISARK